MTADGVSRVTTGVFRGTPSGYVRRVFVAWLVHWWWTWSLPLVFCVVAACFNVMWVFVSFMLVCLLYPGLLMMIYFNYALSPQARRTLLPHSVTLTHDSIRVTYHKPDEDDSMPAVRHLPGDEVYTAVDVKSVEPGADFVTIYLKTPRYHHLSIPAGAIADNDKAKFLTLAQKMCPEMA